MSARQLLRALLLDWHGAIRHPATARAVFFCLATWPGFTGHLIREIHLANGDWRRVVEDLIDNRTASPALPRGRVLAFAAWAEKITRREVRGLLAWPGAAPAAAAAAAAAAFPLPCQ